MGRNRGQGQNSGNDKKGGGEKVKVRRTSRYTDAVRKMHKRTNLLREARRAEKKLSKLLKRGWAQKPGGILEGSQREERLIEHVSHLKAQARTI